ncbi:mechanosensitive ion channel domain-containing protein [Helicobacter saguini]|uniref:mechanosensitive ion channel domain-containing protein n=1 Tax=Helicobacter saguini TaxID=1548018 RepID=UPI000691DEF7|nr:mechanosensitive ion channel domain-containing protein [Helicobacter saguini]
MDFFRNIESRFYKVVFLFFILLCTIIYADNKANVSKNYTNEQKLERLNVQIRNTDSIWLKRYDNFRNYHLITNEISELEKKSLESTLSPQDSHRLETLKKQQTLLEQYRNKPFGELLEKPTLESPPTITNPFGIFSAFSYMKHISAVRDSMQHNKRDLEQLIAMFEKKYELLNEIIDEVERGVDSGDLDSKITESALQNVTRDSINTAKNIESTTKDSINQNKNIESKPKQDSKPTEPQNKKEKLRIYNENLDITRDIWLELESARNIYDTTIDMFDKDADEIRANLELGIKNQLLKLGYIGIGILISIVIAFIFKMLAKRYIANHDRAYTTSKVINFFNITVIFLILLFAYIDNATYAVAMVGFASAGLAIAMKDMFMSTLGWLVIVIGGSIHVGDRIRIKKENEVFIGDVLDISMLRITIYDDITQTSYRENHRAGRLIFIPNNYVFTNLISNYTYGDLSNIWDSVEICITFDSNITKAKNIALQVAQIHAKKYTDGTKEQMQKMRDRFQLVQSALNVEPRVFNFVKQNGMEISVWFQNYAYATLSLKSKIAQEIVEKYLVESDIKIAYPITRIVYQGKDGLGEINMNVLNNVDFKKI